MGRRRDRLDVDEIGIRVADGLDENALGIRPNRIRKALCTRFRIDKGHVDAPVLCRMCKEIVGAAIDGLLRDNMIAHMGECLDRRCDRRRSRGKGKRRRTALECGDALLEHILRRIHEATVDVARVLERKTVGGVLRVMKHVGRV